mgnify:CR=1 FL=1
MCHSTTPRETYDRCQGPDTHAAQGDSDQYVSRGEVVPEEALIDALRQGRILGAGLDTQAKEPPDPTNPLTDPS